MMMRELSVALSVQSFDESNPLILHLRSTFYDQYSDDDNLSQKHLMKVSIPCDIGKD